MVHVRCTVLSPRKHAITLEIHKSPVKVQIFCWLVGCLFHNCCGNLDFPHLKGSDFLR